MRASQTAGRTAFAGEHDVFVLPPSSSSSAVQGALYPSALHDAPAGNGPLAFTASQLLPGACIGIDMAAVPEQPFPAHMLMVPIPVQQPLTSPVSLTDIAIVMGPCVCSKSWHDFE